jgi:hypothetical protein
MNNKKIEEIKWGFKRMSYIVYILRYRIKIKTELSKTFINLCIFGPSIWGQTKSNLGSSIWGQMESHLGPNEKPSGAKQKAI